MSGIDSSEFKSIPQIHLSNEGTQNKELGANSMPPSLVLLQRSIEEGAVQKDPSFSSGIRVDENKVISIVKELLEEFEAVEQRTAEVKLALPDGFNWEEATKDSVKTAMRMMFKSGFISTDLMRASSRFASPGNTSVKDQDHSQLNRDKYLIEYWNRVGWDAHKLVEDPIPLSRDKHERNSRFSLDIGKGSVMFTAGYYLTQAKSLGISLSEKQAVRLGLFASATHEFSHAIDLALAALGIRTKDRAFRAGFVSYDLTDEEREHIHQEYFARGIENMMVRQYLINQGWSEATANATIKNKLEYTKPEADQAKQLVSFAHERGYTADELKEIQRQIINYALIGVDNKYSIRSIEQYLAYRDAPYNEAQVRELMVEDLET